MGTQPAMGIAFVWRTAKAMQSGHAKQNKRLCPECADSVHGLCLECADQETRGNAGWGKRCQGTQSANSKQEKMHCNKGAREQTKPST
jgi:hypothetical protein